MTVANRFDLYDVELGVTGSPVRLPGITGANVPTNTEHKTERTSGALYPQHTAIVGQNVRAMFQSVSVAKCWTQIGLAGLNLADLADATFPGLSIFGYKHSQGGGRAGALAHRKYNFQNGLVFPTRISTDHQGDATISYDVLPTYDGSNNPVVISSGVSVPTAGDDDERYTIGKVVIGGQTLTGIKQLELDLGQAGEQEGADSDLWPTHASMVSTSPVLTLRGIDPEWIDNLGGLTGLAATHANTTVYLRKRSAGSASGYVADGTAEHIKITLDGLAFHEEAYSGDPNSPVGSSLLVPCRYDGTNAPVVVTLNSTIT